jgi:hypothetical protein
MVAYTDISKRLVIQYDRADSCQLVIVNMPQYNLLLLGACSPSTTTEYQNRVSSCVDDVAARMQWNRLQLNSAKTEVLWCASTRRQHQIPQSGTQIGADDVMPSAYVRDFGMYIDADVSMWIHVAETVSSRFAILHHHRSVRRSVSVL